ncbi:hypothetical protein AHAS_Ahas11G0095800 [Arachis hypogaea]
MSQPNDQIGAQAQSQSQSAIHDFIAPIVLKLDALNFLPRKDQIEAMLEGYQLLDHLTGKGIPERFVPNQD